MNAKAGKVDSPSVPRGKLTASEAEQLLLTVNSAAQRIQVLWISFISFGAYVTIAVLGTTHRMLFLEEPVRLPAFNIDLPLQSFYVILPGFFLLFHFYVLVQLILFSRTVAAFEESLIRGVQTETDRELVRMRLDNSLFVQRLAGAEAERIGRNAWFIRLITWLTVVVCPVALLLLIQLKFLP